MGLFDDLTKQAAQARPPAGLPAAPAGGLFNDLLREQPAPAPQPGFIDRALRQGGLTARYALEGLPQTLDIIAAPFKAATDAAAGLLTGQGLGYRSPTLSQMGTQASDAIGLPEPQTRQERVVGTAVRTGFGAAGGVGAARALASAAGTAAPVVRDVATAFAANPGSQVISGTAAGGAAEASKEAGGTPFGQFLAALTAGVAAPIVARGAVGAGTAVRTKVREMAAPVQQVEAVLRTELGRAGVDWDALGAQAKLALAKDVGSLVYNGQPLNREALTRLAQYRAIGATPLLGDITQDPQLLTLQRNLTAQLANMQNPVAKSSLPSLQNENAKRVLGTLESASSSTDDAFASGERMIGLAQGRDAVRKRAEDQLYAQAREAAGRDIPLDRDQFLFTAYGELARQNKGAFLPPEIGNLLKQIRVGEIVDDAGNRFQTPFSVDQIDNLKTVLASAQRGAKDGNVRAAINIVRDALESTQPATTPTKLTFGGNQVATPQTAQTMRASDALPAEAMSKFDAARSAARERRTWQESARFIEDALDGSVPPDTFVRKHIIGAPVDELSKLRAEIGDNRELLESVRKQMADYILARGNADSDVARFGSKGLEDGFKALGERKLSLFFAPEEITQLRAAVRVGKYMQSRPEGSGVNSSNSFNAAAGKIADLLFTARNVPGIGPWITEPARGMALQVQTIPLRNLRNGLATPAPRPTASGASVPLSTLLLSPAIQGSEDDRRR